MCSCSCDTHTNNVAQYEQLIFFGVVFSFPPHYLSFPYHFLFLLYQHSLSFLLSPSYSISIPHGFFFRHFPVFDVPTTSFFLIILQSSFRFLSSFPPSPFPLLLSFFSFPASVNVLFPHFPSPLQSPFHFLSRPLPFPFPSLLQSPFSS